MNVAIVGVTGAVGVEILRLLEQRKFPISSLRCFATAKSAGKTLSCFGKTITIEVLGTENFKHSDIAFFCAGSSVSKQYIPEALSSGAFVVDSSSSFRMDPQVPLLIPEINAAALSNRKLVASPNCAATILLMPLFPLHRLFQIKRIVASTYQAASGAGFPLMRELENETRAHMEGRAYEHQLPFPYAFNLFLHNSDLHESGYSDEELKMLLETRKILEDDSIQMSVTCVRVPVLRAHSISVNVEFHKAVSLSVAREAIASMPGVKLFEDFSENRFPTPSDATGKDDVYCGRLRLDPSQPNTLELWCVGDQLLKGAALNAVQIAEQFKN
jgi:aspartate-semialdehyde dehydrogenase